MENELDVAQFSNAEPEPFETRVVLCVSREAAEAEAQRQQALDTDDATWIYLHVDGQWAAKRTPTDLPLDEPQHRLVEGVVGEVVSGLLDPSVWLNP
ncbi:MAG: hypothetical protein ABSG64_12370 [Solirubrobacteraceae bacterium]